MENTLSDVIFEPSEADFEFVDAMADGLDMRDDGRVTGWLC